MTTELKNGTTVEDPRLDRLYELDWRSLDFPLTSELLKSDAPIYRPRSYTWSVDTWLDQGPDGACVGFAFAHDLVARPGVVEGVGYAKAKEIYLAAQRIDPWPGGAYPGASPRYEGTSTLAGAKICQNDGYFSSYHWAFGVEEVARGIAYFGPCIFGSNWYEGMYNPDRNGFIHPVGQVVGGHAYLVHSLKIVYKSTWTGWWNRTWADVDHNKSYVRIWNSWGRSWGANGQAKISLSDLAVLLRQNGEACFPKRVYDW